jgi:2-polyprenyl-3-methyl-5-hydroxy-6-metoxy-1,4-benzoquinol methylase
MTSVSCPLCASVQSTLIRAIDTARLIALWRRQWDIDIARELAGVAQIDLWKCERCRLQFFTPEWSAGSAQLYSQLEKFDWYYMPQKWEHDVAFAEVQADQTLLEVGCGFGDFVARARAQGVQADGLELNESAVKLARQHGLPVQRIDLREAAEHYPSHYDVVCGFQVLEHVPNPREFLDLSCTLIKSGGRLLLGVPNADSFLMHQSNLLDMPPHHMTRWSSQTMESLQQLFPLRLERLCLEPLAEYHVKWYVEARCAAVLGSGALYRLSIGWIAPGLGAFLKHSGLRQRLVGQTLYASFVRV